MELRAQRALSPMSTTRARHSFRKPALALLTACLMATSALAQVNNGNSQTSSDMGNEVSGPVRLNPSNRTTQDTASAQTQAQAQAQAPMSVRAS